MHIRLLGVFLGRLKIRTKVGVGNYACIYKLEFSAIKCAKNYEYQSQFIPLIED